MAPCPHLCWEGWLLLQQVARRGSGLCLGWDSPPLTSPSTGYLKLVRVIHPCKLKRRGGGVDSSKAWLSRNYMRTICSGQFFSRESLDYLKLGEGSLNELGWRHPGWYTQTLQRQSLTELSHLGQHWWDCWARSSALAASRTNCFPVILHDSPLQKLSAGYSSSPEGDVKSFFVLRPWMDMSGWRNKQYEEKYFPGRLC